MATQDNTTPDTGVLETFPEDALLTELKRRKQARNDAFVKELQERQKKLQKYIEVLLELSPHHTGGCTSKDFERRNGDKCLRCFLKTIQEDGYVPDPEGPGYLDIALSLVTRGVPHPETRPS